jgi:hypothetical protein
MNENKMPGVNDPPEEGKNDAAGAIAACDPGQTRLLPAQPLLDRPSAGQGQNTVTEGKKNAPENQQTAPRPRFRPLSQNQIIWISLSFILLFLIVFFWLIMQKQHKNRIMIQGARKSIAGAEASADSASRDRLKTRIARPAKNQDIVLTEDEFAGQAPLMVKPGGPVVSAAMDPELAAIVDALKKRFFVFAESKTSASGGFVTRVTKGEFRGFKIAVQEKLQDQAVVSEEVTVTFPKKGFMRTVDRVLDSMRDSDAERLALELRNAGLEIAKLPAQPDSGSCRVQLRTIAHYGKPLAADALISGKSVGNISLGMSTNRLENLLLNSHVVLKRKVLVDETYRDVYKVLDQSNEPLFFVYENDGLVWGISIISETFKTEKGIGIGSRLGDIRLSYPRIAVGLSDKKIPFVRIDGIDGVFVVQNENVDVGRRVFPSKTKITSILIGKSLEFD